MIFMTGRGSEHSRRVVQSAEKYFFMKKHIFSHRFKKATQIVSDLIPDAGDVQERRKPSIFMIFDQNQ